MTPENETKLIDSIVNLINGVAYLLAQIVKKEYKQFMAQLPFNRPSRLEMLYRAEIKRLLDTYFQFPTFDTLGELTSKLAEFKASISFFDQLADRLARRMITKMALNNANSWRQAARTGANGRQIYEMLRGNIGGGVGLKINQLVHENSGLIKSLPQRIAGTINHHIYMQFTQGVRSETIMEQIRPYMHGAKEYQIQRLARTEVAKADTAITEVRALDLGLNWYVWKSAHDARVRKSHKLMNDVLVQWNDPPSPELLVGEKFEGRYPAGGVFNCRCVALPLVRVEQISFPVRIYINGSIMRMGYAQFVGISGLRKLAAQVSIMARAYFATRVGPNTGETPEGYFLFTDAVIGRTGFQKYKGSELPQRGDDTDKDEITMQDIGVGPDDMVDVYRPAEEVFHPATIASFENKVITDEHPSELLNNENTKQHAAGHIFNVRKGKEPLATGDWPLLADGMVTDKALIDKIRAGTKDLSCGYNYRVAKNGNQVVQVGIVGNHLAVVPNGRAGLAFIRDSAVDLPEVEAVATPKEILSMNALLKKIMGLGVKAYAADANLKPEELSELLEMQEQRVLPVAKDAEEDEHPKGCRCEDCMPSAKDKKPKAKDAVKAEAKDEENPRKRFHDALERHLDSMEQEKVTKDNDLNELRMLMAPGNTVSKETPGLDADEDEEEKEEKEEKGEDSMIEAEGEDAEEDVKENEEARETEETAAADEELSASSPIIEPVDRQKPDVPSAVDAEALKRQGAAMALKAFRPFVARSNDKALRAGFDSVVKAYSKGSLTKGNGSYSKAASGAAARDSATPTEKVRVAPNTNLSDLANKAYAQAKLDMSKVNPKGSILN